MSDNYQLSPEQFAILKRLDASIMIAEATLIEAQNQRAKWIESQEFLPTSLDSFEEGDE